MNIPGMHHVTAFARSPRENIDFYSRILGLRTIKITVNYDDPASYHLYFADRIGTPGTVLTFFPHPNARPGKIGSGQASTTAFAVPINAMDFWSSRLSDAGIELDRADRFDEPSLSFHDPDGLHLELIGVSNQQVGTQPWATNEVAGELAIIGFHSVRLTVRDPQPTCDFLEAVFGYRVMHTSGTITRLQSPAEGIASIADVEQAADGAPRGSFGPGTVHHVAWRVANDEELEQMRTTLIDRGVNVTEIKNRNYFRSIYFREPGGVIFEIATDGPGFTVDEAEEELGSGLRLPPWLESDRARIEAQLAPIDDTAVRPE